ncbi:hypothetical protein QFZ21_004145 [Microbacterium sp. W4I20]|nr:hypothetical protein [Microbacterium sp. W4I20]
MRDVRTQVLVTRGQIDAHLPRLSVNALSKTTGSEVAALNEVPEVLKRTDLSESLVAPVWVQLRAGASGTGLRGDSFNP